MSMFHFLSIVLPKSAKYSHVYLALSRIKPGERGYECFLGCMSYGSYPWQLT